jgi:drug/metabolite transporter (DMT)-like permease
MNKLKHLESTIVIGHAFALFTAFVWGVTFVSTKLLLNTYTPLAIMMLRFSLAYICLWLIHPKFYKVTSWREESIFLLAGITGVSGYFYLENTAMLYTSVSNTGLILSAAPLFVAIVTHLFTPDEKFHLNLLLGFLLAMIGVALIIFNGQINLKVNLFGDLLAILAAVVWAFYSLAIKKMNQAYSSVYLTRRTFFYGIVIGSVMIMTIEGGLDISKVVLNFNWTHLIFLGVLASATCYVLWNGAIRRIGAVKTSNYIYLMPLFTMIASAIVLKEHITGLMIVGCVFILLGVYTSERGLFFLKKRKTRS